VSGLYESAQLMAKTLLQHALDRKERVVVMVRGDPTRGQPARRLEGVPVEFRPLPDGRERVVLELVAGETLQMVRLDVILTVTVARD